MDNIKSKHDTSKEFAAMTALCRDIFIKKMSDYGMSWRVMRPSSLTDQIYIKARRIRSIEEKGMASARVNEGIEPEFIGIVNYCAIALIQLRIGPGDYISQEKATELYDKAISDSTSLMLNKNHDYDEAWRHMRVSSFTDIILQKLLRTREIEDHNGQTIISEGVDANYMDMINYAMFALIKLNYED
ncbi:DUF1599 domain-containing protein [Lepagella muris]|jgi:hypothetical protein|uniref:DUF1599 domain-containing protein n=2 Tax=Muribaculaceae TaxID=2005473 RepID=A0AC61RDW6_9BACT|nr:DUF1599 domain-containing protein [Lepagella muris]ROT09285.1 DUF1599 domain-containing protein [Muribaculaceae bacterium Isolate-037 (Harlan)]TGY77029.1 DUF1599 domain-containing protein [Lepagella muris]THG47032.1 DUF1599 domain-containing protein [Bacteroidales bacterium]TKC54326.1 DUF1599 domain-containing protein [Bacteroidales bacterium]